MDFFDYLKKQPRWMTRIIAFIIVCMPVMVAVDVLVGNEISNYVSLKFKIYHMDEVLKYAVQLYILETDDVKLKFGKNETVKDVDELVKNLQIKAVYNGVEYEPFINYSFPKSRLGLKVVINKDQGDAKVLFADKDSIEFLNDTEFSKISEGIDGYVNTKVKWPRLIQLIINISLFTLWNVLVLICSLILCNITRKISALKFSIYVILNIVTSIIVSLSYLFIFPIWLCIYIVVTLIINALITRLLLKEATCTRFKKIMAVFMGLPVFISILTLILNFFVDMSRYM